MRLSSRVQNLLLVLAIVGMLPLIRLGEGDLVIDEVIYAWRAMVIAATGNPLAPVSITHFYGFQPPLALWAMAASIKLLGFSSFAVRLVPALSLIPLALAAYLLARRTFDVRESLAAAALVGSCSIAVRYAQFAQLDIPGAALSALAIWLLLRAWEGRSSRAALVAGVVHGAAFMAKLIMPALPFVAACVWLAVLWMREIDERRAIVRLAGMYVGAALLVAAPWHLWMLFGTGGEFWNVGIMLNGVERVMHGTGASAKDTGRFYAVNQLVIAVPLFVAVCWSIVGIVARRIRGIMDEWVLLIALWGGVVIVALTLMPRILESYISQAVVPAVLLSLYAARALGRRDTPAWLRAAALWSLALAIVWGAGQIVRDSVRSIVSPSTARIVASPVPAYAAGLLVLVGAAVVLVLWRFRPAWLSDAWLRIPVWVAAGSVIVRAAVLVFEPPWRMTGGAAVASTLPAHGAIGLVTGMKNDQDACTQFHCYDKSGTAWQRMVVYERGEVARNPVFFPDSLHVIVLERPEAYFAADSSANVVRASLESQAYACTMHTPRYLVFVRGLLR